MADSSALAEDRGDGVQSRAFGQFIAERRGPLASQLLCQDARVLQ